jgi:hypothetical protein
LTGQQGVDVELAARAVRYRDPDKPDGVEEAAEDLGVADNPVNVDSDSVEAIQVSFCCPT